MDIEKSTTNSAAQNHGVSPLSRRAVLCGMAAIALGTNPERAIAATGVTVNSAGQIEVLLSANPALKKVGGVILIQLQNGAVLALARTSASTSGFTALNLSCTHQGVTVNQSGSKWICPAHGSAFAFNGKVTHGPARSNLQTFKTKATAKNVLVYL